MLKTVDEVFDVNGVGVIVGRFQVTELTDGHKSLFNSVIARHHKMICVIGLSEIKASKNNPLDFEARRKMIFETYPDIQIVYIKDNTNDSIWSNKLDSIIATHTPPNSSVVLYGSRDSFILYYGGKFETKELMQESFTSGTNDRSNNSFNTGNTKDFRKGAIWATQNQYDSCFPTVDVAIVDDSERLLLARKQGETLFRFVGGFVSPQGGRGEPNFLEKNAKRVVSEESQIETSDYQYIGSFLVDDWRYRAEKSKVITTLFKASYVFGKPVPSSDIDELRWFDINTISLRAVVNEHRPLLDYFLNNINS